MTDEFSFLAVQVIVWTCVVLFIATAIVTILALVGKTRLGGGDGGRHDYYLKRLFLALLVEIIGISLAAYAAYMRDSKEQIRKLEDLPQISTPIESVAPKSGVKVARENISTKVYATSDGPKSDSKTVQVPSGWRYVTHTVNVWTENGRASYTVNPVIDAVTGRVTAVNVSASVGKRDVFGPRNWIGVALVVTVEKQSPESSD